MELTFPDRPEQAIVAAVIQHAGRIAEQKRRYLGRTAMQKILYFVQVCGVPLRYRFEIYHYGPFCSAIFNDIDWLTIMEIVEDKSPNPEKYSDYRVTTRVGEFLNTRQDEAEPYRPIIQRVCEALVPLTPEQLELVTTLDYAYREMRARKNSKPQRNEVVDRFVQFKGEKFARSQVEDLYQRLEQVGAF